MPGTAHDLAFETQGQIVGIGRQQRARDDAAANRCAAMRAAVQDRMNTSVGEPQHPDLSSSRLEDARSEEHTSELQSLMRISYAVFCLKKKKQHTTNLTQHHSQNKIS